MFAGLGKASRQKVSSILALEYLEYLVTLCVKNTKNQAIKKWLPFKLICAIYLEYIVSITLVRSYPNLLTLYVQ